MAFGFIKLLNQIKDQLSNIAQQKNDDKALQVARFLADNLYNHPKYKDSKRLNKYEYQSFSQYGEDGIIQEIFNRIGTTNKYFIEFGVENGLECNSLNLLYKKWQGLWIEGDSKYCQDITTRFADMISNNQLAVKNEFITAENIESLFESAGVPAEPDIISIDIDYNDYYVWQAISKYSPRVVVIEYNATYQPETDFVVPYNPTRVWDGSSFFGASLAALEQLGKQKGYSLVSCSFAGTNAFFVRNDLMNDTFEAPYTAAHHYEPVRYYLYHKNGHRRSHLPT
jgi:hypothetical protein